MASMRIKPSDVLIAHTEYSVWPRKYRLSNTLTGSACHDSRAGGPVRRPPPAPRCAGAGGGSGGTASRQIRLYTPAKSVPAAAFAASRCVWTLPPGRFCASAAAIAAAMRKRVTGVSCSPFLFRQLIERRLERLEPLSGLSEFPLGGQPLIVGEIARG